MSATGPFAACPTKDETREHKHKRDLKFLAICPSILSACPLPSSRRGWYPRVVPTQSTLGPHSFQFYNKIADMHKRVHHHVTCPQGQFRVPSTPHRLGMCPAEEIKQDVGVVGVQGHPRVRNPKSESTARARERSRLATPISRGAL